MEWINGVRCTDPAAIRRTVNVQEFIRVGVVSGMRQLLEFGLFHGDPHPGNVFAMPDGRIAYVDFGNVAQLSQYNKQVRRSRLRCVFATPACKGMLAVCALRPVGKRQARALRSRTHLRCHLLLETCRSQSMCLEALSCCLSGSQMPLYRHS